jgi:hypothetical protein
MEIRVFPEKGYSFVRYRSSYEIISTCESSSFLFTYVIGSLLDVRLPMEYII